MCLLKVEGNKNKPIAKEKVSFLFTNGKKFSDRLRFLQSGRNGSKGAIPSEDLRPCSTPPPPITAKIKKKNLEMEIPENAF